LLLLSLSAGAGESARVLVLHSYHHGFSWTDGVDAGIRDVLGNRKDIILYTEYMDSKRHALPDIEPVVRADIKQKYDSHTLDAVIISDNNALTLLTRYQDELLTNVPIIFCGINNFTPDMIQAFEGRITGTVEAVDPAGTVRLIIELQPELRRLFLVSGTTPTAQAVVRETEKALAEMDTGDLELVWWQGLTTAELCRRLETVEPDDAVLLILFNRDGSGAYYSYEDAARLISRRSAAPVYGMWDFYLANGVVGGRMASSRDQGRAAGRLVQALLKTGSLPPIITESPNVVRFDAGALRRHGLDVERLPPEVELFGDMEQDMDWRRWLAVLLGGLLLILVVFCLAQIVKGRGRMQLSSMLVWNVRMVVFLLTAGLLLAAVSISWMTYQAELRQTRRRIIREKKDKMVMMVDLAVDLIGHARMRQVSSGQDVQVLKDQLKDRLAAMRYEGGEGYIFINNLQGDVLVNPMRPDLVGQNTLEMTDPDGVRMVRELTAAARYPGGGFVSYVWPKPGQQGEVEKLSYARCITDWGWIVGSGLYLDEVDAAMARASRHFRYLLLGQGVLIMGLGIVVLAVTWPLTRRMSRHITSEINRITAILDAGDGEALKVDKKAFHIAEFSYIAAKSGDALMRAAQLQRNLRSFFDGVDDFFFVVDLEGRIVAVNRAVRDRLGYTAEELAGQPVETVHIEHRREEATAFIADMLAGKAERCPVPLQAKDGRIIEVETKITHGIWENEPVIFGVSVDITARKKAEAEAQRMYEETQRMNRLMDGREDRVLELKREVNALLTMKGHAPKYRSVTE
jgi:PAS domain S-box-containing protein